MATNNDAFDRDHNIAYCGTCGMTHADPPCDSSIHYEEGDVVYAEGASAILGDVLAVSDEGVCIRWRSTVTTEQPEDLHKAPPT